MDILDVNASCPICGKFYHRWSIHRNPIPTKKDQRTAASLCQCQKGQDAREFLQMKRMEIENEQKQKKALRGEWFNRGERNQAYWNRVESNKLNRR